jgi:hypothetical protein
MLIAAVTGLALVTRRVPLWVPAAMATIEVCWIELAWPYVTDHYSLLDFDPTASAAPEGYEAGNGLPGFELVSLASRLGPALLAALAAIGIVRRVRAGRWDAAVGALIVAPVLVVGAQSYSGEGRYRLYLFALPWLCFFAAAALAPATRSWIPAAAGRWRLALASGALGTCLLFSYFGLELVNRMTSRDIAPAVWYEHNAPPDSVLVEVTSNSISRVSGRYAVVNDPNFPFSPTLTDRAGFHGHRLGRGDLPRLDTTLRDYGAEHTYLVLTDGQERFARLYGLLPPGWRTSFERALRSSPAFRRVFRHGDSSIYKYEPNRTRSVR